MAGQTFPPKMFDFFKAETLRFQELLGLHGWRIYFEQSELERRTAHTDFFLPSHVACIQVAFNWPEHIPPTEENVSQVALHEMLHCLEIPLKGKAESEERIINTLVKVMSHLWQK